MIQNIRNVYRRIASELKHFGSSLRHAKSMDLLIVSGGGQIDEYWGGPWAHPFTLLKWSVAATLVRTPIILISVGRGEVTSKLGRLFILLVLRLSDYRSYRDSRTKAIMKNQYAFTSDDLIVPDLAFSLPHTLRPTRTPLDRKKLTVGISPMAYQDPRCWPDKNPSFYNNYIDKLRMYSEALLAEGARLVFFPSAYQQDTPPLLDLSSALRKSCSQAVLNDLSTPSVSSVSDLLQAVSSCDVVVASRLHGIILSHWLTIPTIALSYDPKVDQLMEDMKRADYCFNIETFDLDQLKVQSQTCVTEMGAIRSSIRERIDIFNVAIQQQYDFIVARYLTDDSASPLSSQN
jgi:polysaccharide pyruvyl transferase WcaK-like protein